MSTRDALHYPTTDRTWLQAYLPPSPSSPQDEPTTSSDPSRPFVTLTFATSLDSALALAPGKQTALSGPQSKAMTHYLRSVHDAILIGAGTACVDDPSLNCRLEGVGGYGSSGLAGQPRPVVVDPNGRWEVSEDRKVVRLAGEGRGRGPWVVTSFEPGRDRREVLRGCGGEYIVLPSEKVSGKVVMRWRDILGALKERGIGSVMIEGGGAVINDLLNQDNIELIDSVIITIAPVWLGAGSVAVLPQRSEGQERASLPVARLQQTRWNQLGDDAVLCGKLGKVR